MNLSDKERIRYSRHLLLPEIGEHGQLCLKQAHVVVVGCGGLGSPALFYLAASGIGQLSFIDDDELELSNLQRQILYKINYLGQSKATAAGKVLASLNNQITLNPIVAKVTEDTVETYLQGADCVLDCSDNFATRYVLNRYCRSAGIPLVAGAAQGLQGQIMAFDFRTPSPCYECVFPAAEEQLATASNCDTIGVLSPLLGVIGAQQAMLTMQLLLGTANTPYFAFFDAAKLKQQSLKLTRDPNCACSK
ncbi:HesA/MoeB/ThiF family protein [Pseudoalteromonas fenneropenaei]|uniref:HesA/MoeB/ThiF family protein n=1 Tax=Pseudoalteromonas fenneropenaei TaxID=1737459 RepID=A0ABV7CNG2_9GAMM